MNSLGGLEYGMGKSPGWGMGGLLDIYRRAMCSLRGGSGPVSPWPGQSDHMMPMHWKSLGVEQSILSASDTGGQGAPVLGT